MLLQQPSDLRSREIRIEHEPGPLPDLVLVARFLQLTAEARGPAILPDDGTRHGLERLPVPQHDGFALVRDPDPPHLRTVPVARTRGLECCARDAATHLPDLRRVVLDPTRLREVLRELRVRPAEDAAVVSDDQAGGPGRALVDGEYGGNGHASLATESLLR